MLACDSTWVNSFYSAFLNIHWSGVLTALAWLVPQESAARESQSRRILCTSYNRAPCHFMQSHIHNVHACLVATCHLRFWQDDRGLLRATAVTRGWNGYRNKSQHRKLTLEKKILPPPQQGFEPVTFRSRVRRSNHCSHQRGNVAACGKGIEKLQLQKLCSFVSLKMGVLQQPPPPHTHTHKKKGGWGICEMICYSSAVHSTINNNVHLSCTHQHPERSHDTYWPKYDILYTHRASSYQNNLHKVL